MSGISTNVYTQTGRNMSLEMKVINEKRKQEIAVEYYFRFYSFIYDISPRKFFEPRFTKNYFRDETWRIRK